nr:aspartate aminotransferase family protein [bacterium]
MMHYAEAAEKDSLHAMGVFGQRLLLIEKGEGCTLYDDTGKAYTDFLAGIAVNALGYRHPAIQKALAEQADKLLHVSNYFYVEPQVNLAERLTAACGMSKVFFANSGAEANEGAIKLARRYWSKKGEGRTNIVSLNGSFHGRTLSTLAATGQAKYQQPFEPLPQGFCQVPGGDVAALEQAAQGAAAVLIELVQGENGVIMWPEGYLKAVQDICRKTGALLIVDEVQTGIGRTGQFLACQTFDIKPDILTLAKALGGGLPLGAVLCNNKADVFSPGEHGSTFGGNPVSCAVAGAVLDEVLGDGFLQVVREKGARLGAGLEEMVQRYPGKAVQARGVGLMRGLQLDAGLPGKQVVLAMQEKGYIINCAGHNTLRFVPPLIISQGEIDAMLSALGDVLGNA